jgi:hypothetical protein
MEEFCKFCGMDYYNGYAQHLNYCGGFLGAISGEIGLSNKPSFYNCFLNCALQAILHTDPSHKLVKALDSPSEGSDELGVTLCGFFKGLESPLVKADQLGNVDDLRRSLAQAYQPQNRFREYWTDDSTDALEALLNAAHNLLTSGRPTSVKCDPKCTAHEVFGIELQETVKCRACDASTASTYEAFYLPINVDMLLSRSYSRLPSQFRNKLLELLTHLYASKASEAVLSCPSSCGGNAAKATVVTSVPDVLSLKLIWADPSPCRGNVACIMASIPTSFNLSQVFQSIASQDYELNGLVFFSPGHYFAVFKNTSGQWVTYEDECILLVPGKASYTDVIKEALRREAYPSQVFYGVKQDISFDELDTIISEGNWAALGTEPVPQRRHVHGSDYSVHGCLSSGQQSHGYYPKRNW